MTENTMKTRILICENEAVIADDLKTRLIRLGHDVCGQAASGEKVLALVEELQPDLVMMDIAFRGERDGIATSTIIRDRWGMPVVFTITDTDTDLLVRAKPTYPFGFLFKPFQDRDLEITITMALFAAKADAERRTADLRFRRRQESIMEPGLDIASLKLTDIIDTDMIQSLMDDFHRLTGIGVAILDLHGTVLVATGWQDICTQFHRQHPETSRYCLESDTELSHGVEPGQYKLYRCKNNMWDMATPIVVGGNHAGNLFLGQFLFDDEEPDYTLFKNQAARYGFNEQNYLEALTRVPRWSRERVDRVMTFYSKFCSLISSLSYSRFQLMKSLAEKEILLKELHHRVKNNMQVIISLIKLQADQLSDPTVISAFRELQSRIYAMSAVHETLHQSANAAKIDLAEYLTMLSEGAFHMADPGNTHIQTDLTSTEVPLDKSYPIGLLVNELLSNSFKHAFPKGRTGRITISSESDSDMLTLVISDNGVGIPSDFDWMNTDSLGLQLVHTLVTDQLGGSIMLDRSNGTRWKITIPRNKLLAVNGDHR
jgi:two-component sensor histidine kinase